MRISLMTMGALFAFAACDDKSSSDTDPTGEADADTDADTDTDTSCDTACGPPPPVEPYYWGYYFEFGVDENGNIVANDSDFYKGETIDPILVVRIEDEDNEAYCEVVLSMLGATPVTPSEGNWAAWMVDSSAALISDSCSDLNTAEMTWYGTSPGYLWSVYGLQINVELGPFNTEFWDGYGLEQSSPGYAPLNGGGVSDFLLYYSTTGGATGIPLYMDAYSLAFPVDDADNSYDYYTPFTPAEVPLLPEGTGVNKGHYFGFTLLYPYFPYLGY